MGSAGGPVGGKPSCLEGAALEGVLVGARRTNLGPWTPAWLLWDSSGSGQHVASLEVWLVPQRVDAWLSQIDELASLSCYNWWHDGDPCKGFSVRCCALRHWNSWEDSVFC